MWNTMWWLIFSQGWIRNIMKQSLHAGVKSIISIIFLWGSNWYKMVVHDLFNLSFFIHEIFSCFFFYYLGLVFWFLLMFFLFFNIFFGYFSLYNRVERSNIKKILLSDEISKLFEQISKSFEQIKDSFIQISNSSE